MSICGTSVLIAICGFIYKGGRKPFVQKKSLHPQYFRKNNVQKITPLSLDRASSFACHESLLNINWRSYCFSTMVTRYRVGPFQKLRITNYTDQANIWSMGVRDCLRQHPVQVVNYLTKTSL